MNKAKIISMILLVVLIVNLVLVGLGAIPIIAFWSIIGVAALFAYWVLPRMRE